MVPFFFLFWHHLWWHCDGALFFAPYVVLHYMCSKQAKKKGLSPLLFLAVFHFALRTIEPFFLNENVGIY